MVMPEGEAMVRSPNGSTERSCVTLNGVSQRPMNTLPKPPVTPTPLLRVAKAFVPPVVSSALKPVSSWPQALRLPVSAFSARTPRSDELSEMRVRDDIGALPPSDFTASAVRNTRP